MPLGDPRIERSVGGRHHDHHSLPRNTNNASQQLGRAQPGGSALQADGQVAPLLDGGYVVVWTDSSRQPFPAGNPLGSAIIGQRYDSSGAKVGGEVKISQFNSGDQFAPAIAALPNGNVAIAFTDQFSGNDNIYVRIYSPTLTLVRTDTVSYTHLTLPTIYSV